MIKTSTLIIPNIGRVRPDIEGIVIQSAMDAIGTVLAKELKSGHLTHLNDYETNELVNRFRKEVRSTVRDSLECPVSEWNDKSL